MGSVINAAILLEALYCANKVHNVRQIQEKADKVVGLFCFVCVFFSFLR